MTASMSSTSNHSSYTVSLLVVTIADRTVMVFCFEAVQQNDKLPIRDQLPIFGALMIFNTLLNHSGG